MSLEAVINFFVNTKKATEDLNKLNKMFENFGKGISRFFTFGIPTIGLVAGARSIYKELENIGNLSERFSLPVSEIGTFENLLASFGGSSDVAINALDKLESAITQLRATASGPLLTVGSQIPLSLYKMDGGIKNSIELLQDLHEQFKRLPTIAKTTVLSELGISDPSIRRLLESSDADFNIAFQKARQNNRVSQDSIKTMATLRNGFSELKRTFRDVGVDIASEIAPLSSDFASWVSEHRQDVHHLITVLEVTAGVIVGMADALYFLAEKAGFAIGWLSGALEDAYDWVGKKIFDGLNYLGGKTYEGLNWLTGQGKVFYGKDYYSGKIIPINGQKTEDNMSPIPIEEMPQWSLPPSNYDNSSSIDNSSSNVSHSVRNTFNFNITNNSQTDSKEFLRSLQTVIRNSTTGVMA